MIVIGADTHKRSHTVAAVSEATGRALADVTVSAKRRAFDDLLRWARGQDTARVWAIEDCRHVSGALERFLLARGERVVRVSPKLMAGARRSGSRPVQRTRRHPQSVDEFFFGGLFGRSRFGKTELALVQFVHAARVEQAGALFFDPHQDAIARGSSRI